jgi:hypothetical protein
MVRKAMTLAAFVMTPVVVTAQPSVLTHGQLDGVTAGAGPTTVEASSVAAAIGDYAAVASDARTAAAAGQFAGVAVGISGGVAGACCEASSAVADSAASATGVVLRNGTRSLMRDGIAKIDVSVSFVATTSRWRR